MAVVLFWIHGSSSMSAQGKGGIDQQNLRQSLRELGTWKRMHTRSGHDGKRRGAKQSLGTLHVGELVWHIVPGKARLRLHKIPKR